MTTKSKKTTVAAATKAQINLGAATALVPLDGNVPTPALTPEQVALVDDATAETIVADVPPLSEQEEEKLNELLGRIENNMVDVGAALYEILTNRLYRVFGDWNYFCKDQFCFSGRYGQLLIQNYRTHQKLLETVPELADHVDNESKLTEIGKAPPEKFEEVIVGADAIAADAGRTRTTAADYRAAVAVALGKEPGEEEEKPVGTGYYLSCRLKVGDGTLAKVCKSKKFQPTGSASYKGQSISAADLKTVLGIFAAHVEEIDRLQVEFRS